MQAARVLLADDHALVRQGLRALLEREGFPVAGEASAAGRPSAWRPSSAPRSPSSTSACPC
jgi:DNA-binding NarL/FixJ family response regulator